MPIDDPFTNILRTARCGCCGRERACETGDINFIMLDRRATWKYPVHGNVLDGGPIQGAVSIACAFCIFHGRPPLEAVEAELELGTVRYHKATSLEALY